MRSTGLSRPAWIASDASQAVRNAGFDGDMGCSLEDAIACGQAIAAGAPAPGPRSSP